MTFIYLDSGIRLMKASLANVLIWIFLISGAIDENISHSGANE